jgi:hypothetical protein
MHRLDGVVLLACVCVLLVVVSGGVESGKVVGFNFDGFSLGFLGRIGIHVNPTTGTQVNSTTSTQVSYTTSTQGNYSSSETKTTMNTSGGSPINSPPNPFEYLPALPVWLLATVAVVCFGGASLLILRRRTNVRVLDLEGTLQEMDQQRTYLEETWSYKLRNAALLRYYLLMRRACLSVGLRDEPAETPQEYVRRISSFFKVENPEATEFASAVNRSRYGEELSELEVRKASKFMGAFADVIRRRAGENR